MGLWLKGLSERKNTMACFRTFLKSSKKKITLKVAAAGTFRVVVGGQFIGYGPRRSVAGKSVVNEYDISEYLSQKDAYLVVEIVYHGTDSFYIIDEQPFFYCRVYENGQLIAKESDFEAFVNETKRQKVKRYSWQRGFLESYRYDHDPALNYYGDSFGWRKCTAEEVCCNEIIERDLPYPSFNEMPFSNIEEGGVERRMVAEPINCGVSSAYVKGLSVAFNDEELECDAVSEMSKYVLDAKSESKDRFTTYCLSGNKTGFIKFKIKAFDDCEIFCVFDEICNYEKTLRHTIDKKEAERIFNELYLNGTLPIHFARMSMINVIRFSLKKGEYDLCSFEPYTMKYLRIIAVGAKAEIKDVALTLYENDSVYGFSYEVSDERRKAVFRAAESTLAQNSVDILTDCPSRERGGWLCDSYFSARAEKLLTGNNYIEKNFIDSFLYYNGRKDLPDGIFPMVYPSNHYDGKFIPNWCMFFFLEIEDYLKRTGDRGTVDKFKDKALGLYDYLRKFENEYGLLEDLGSWVFVEWSKSNEYTDGVNFPTNMLYGEFLRSISRLYGMSELDIKAEALCKHINELSFNGTFYEDNAVREDGKLVLKGHITETCQYYAFYFGIANEINRKELYKIVFYDFLDPEIRNGKFGFVAKSNMFIGDILRLDYLYKTGKCEKAVKECLEIFYSMAEKTGTLWEFEGATASCCHAFASVCVCWLDEERKKK